MMEVSSLEKVYIYADEARRLIAESKSFVSFM
jgi:hypothetical protein